MTETQKSYKSGFVSIIGCPNVGKSTLLNKLIGQKVAIVSPRAQTTRNRIQGVLSGAGYQIVFLDTPGAAAPRNRLGEYMQKVADGAMDEVEAILLVIDPVNGLRERDDALLEKVRRAKAPVIGLVNKADIAEEGQLAAARTYLEQARVCRHIAEISAATGEGLDALLDILKQYLQEGPQYFPEDMVTDQPERVLCAEFIREKALLFLREEVPHGLGVDIDKMALREQQSETDKPLMDIMATIYCEREGHKGIIIGKAGTTLKQIGMEARKEIEWMLGVKVNLQLYVKVRENWRNSQFALRELGYE